MEFRILGPLDAVDDTAPVELTGGKQKALLALLLLHGGRVVPIERIVDDLWGDDAPESARKMVQIFVSHLRKQLPPGLIETRRPGYRCVLDGHSLDLRQFEALAARGRDALTAGRFEEAASALREALALWRGPPLAEFDEPFAREEEARLAEQQLVCLEQRIDADLALGGHAELVAELHALVRRHPLRERLLGQLMLALYRCGRQAEALDAFREFRRTLRDELGIEASSNLKDLERLVLQQDASLEVAPTHHGVGREPAADAPVPESRRTVTVLVADVTTPEAPEDPEARREFMHERAGDAARELSRHGADVVGLGAARLLAVFGVPVAHDDDALRAVSAALAVRDRTAGTRIGVSSGEVVTGDPVVAGAPVEDAIRLQELAAPGEVVSAPRTWRAVRHAAKADGRRGAWSIVSVDPGAAAVPRRFDNPLVGRDSELGEIVSALARAADAGRPHFVTVFGAAGVGKTRLAIECVARLRESTTPVVVRCRAGSQETTYAPLRDVLVSLADGDPVEWVRKRLGEGGARLAEQLIAATGLATGAAHAEDVALATRRLLTGIARKRALLLVIDDAHWGAPAFLDLVEALVGPAHAPLLVLCLARPDLLDIRPRWGGGPMSSSTIMLDALAPADSGTLLDHLVAEGDLDAARHERILTVAEGNPLFIEQLLAASLEGDGETVPDSIQTLLAARLDRLDMVDRAVVSAASVAGASFATADVAALVDGDVAASLAHLVRRDLVRAGEVDDPDGAGWSFRHSLIRDVAYASIPKRRRAELHERLAARAAERGADGDAFAAFHLDHALRALLETGVPRSQLEGLAADAAEHLRRAGLAATDREDWVAAAALLERANELLPRDSRQRVDFLPKLGELLPWIGRVDAAQAVLDEAYDLAAELGDAALAAHARIAKGHTMMRTDTPVAPEQMLRDIDEAVPVLERAGDHEGLATAELLRFHALDQAGLPGAEDRLAIALAHARQAPIPRVEHRVTSMICVTLPRGSVPIDDAIARVEDIRRTTASAYVEASAIGALGLLRAAQGQFDEGRALVRTTRRALEELGLRQATAAHSIAMGEVELLAGEQAAAERILRKGYGDVTALADHHSAANVAWRLGLALAHQGNDDEAERFGHIAKRTRPRGVWVDVWWRVVLALVAGHRGDAPRASALVREARERVRSAQGAATGMGADVLLESADALRAAGRREEALALAADAAGIAAHLGYRVAQQRAAAAQRALAR